MQYQNILISIKYVVQCVLRYVCSPLLCVIRYQHMFVLYHSVLDLTLIPHVYHIIFFNIYLSGINNQNNKTNI